MNTRSLTRIALLPAILLGLAGFTAWQSASGSCPWSHWDAAFGGKPAPLPASPKQGDQPPAFSSNTIDGQSVSLANYKGKVVLIDFWASWCGHCAAELPNVKATYDQFHPQGFEILGMSMDDSKDTLRSYIASKGMPWPQVFCADGARIHDPSFIYGVTAIPYSVLIGKDGAIAAVNLRGDALAAAVEKALK